MQVEENSLNDDILELQEQIVKKDSILFLTDNIAIGCNTIQLGSDADSADPAESAFKIVRVSKRNDNTYIELTGGILQYELLI